jgi:hypothetical protein
MVVADLMKSTGVDPQRCASALLAVYVAFVDVETTRQSEGSTLDLAEARDLVEQAAFRAAAAVRRNLWDAYSCGPGNKRHGRAL